MATGTGGSSTVVEYVAGSIPPGFEEGVGAYSDVPGALPTETSRSFVCAVSNGDGDCTRAVELATTGVFSKGDQQVVAVVSATGREAAGAFEVMSRLWGTSETPLTVNGRQARVVRSGDRDLAMVVGSASSGTTTYVMGWGVTERTLISVAESLEKRSVTVPSGIPVVVGELAAAGDEGRVPVAVGQTRGAPCVAVVIYPWRCTSIELVRGVVGLEQLGDQVATVATSDVDSVEIRGRSDAEVSAHLDPVPGLPYAAAVLGASAIQAGGSDDEDENERVIARSKSGETLLDAPVRVAELRHVVSDRSRRWELLGSNYDGVPCVALVVGVRATEGCGALEDEAVFRVVVGAEGEGYVYGATDPHVTSLRVGDETVPLVAGSADLGVGLFVISTEGLPDDASLEALGEGGRVLGEVALRDVPPCAGGFCGSRL